MKTDVDHAGDDDAGVARRADRVSVRTGDHDRRLIAHGCPSRARTWTPFRAPEPKSGVPTNFTKGHRVPIREFAPEKSNLD